MAVIFSHRLFITASSLIISAGNSAININLSMISTRSYLIIYARILEPASKRSSYKTASEFLEKPSYQPHDIYRALDVLGNECDFISRKFIKTVIFSESETILSCIMTVQTISLRLSRKMGTENTAKAKNTVLTRSSRWGCLWTVMGYLLLFHFSPETQMNRLP